MRGRPVPSATRNRLAPGREKCGPDGPDTRVKHASGRLTMSRYRRKIRQSDQVVYRFGDILFGFGATQRLHGDESISPARVTVFRPDEACHAARGRSRAVNERTAAEASSTSAARLPPSCAEGGRYRRGGGVRAAVTANLQCFKHVSAFFHVHVSSPVWMTVLTVLPSATSRMIIAAW